MIRRPVRRDFNASVPILQVLAIAVVIGVARRPDTGFAGCAASVRTVHKSPAVAVPTWCESAALLFPLSCRF